MSDYFILNSFHVQIIVLEFLFCFGNARRKNFYARLLPSLCAYILIPLVIKDGFFNRYLMIGSWFTTGFLFMLLLSFGILLFSYDIPFMELVFYVSAAHTLQHLVYCLSLLLYRTFGYSSLVNQTVMLCLMTICCVISYFVLIKRVRATQKIDLRSPSLIIFAILSTLFIYFISYWTAEKEIFTYGSILFEILCCILLIVILFDIFENRRLRQNELIMEHMLHLESEQHEMSKANIEVINRKCHDLKYQIGLLRSLEDKAEQDRTISELEKDIMIYDSFAKTGNKELDILFADKVLLAERDDIQIRLMVDGSLFDFIELNDLFSLFGNAMDNAIEAVLKIEDKPLRIITVKAFRKFDFVTIHVENPCLETVDFSKGLPVTTKTDKDYHGYGLKSMKHIAQKYGGQLTCRQKDNIFTLNILFPVRK